MGTRPPWAPSARGKVGALTLACDSGSPLPLCPLTLAVLPRSGSPLARALWGLTLS